MAGWASSCLSMGNNVFCSPALFPTRTMHMLFSNRKLKIVGSSALVLSAVSTIVFLYSDSAQHTWLSPLSHGIIHPSSIAEETSIATSTVPASPTSDSSAAASDREEAQHTPPSAAIVAAVKLETDLEWLSEIHNHSTWETRRYNYNDPKPPSDTWFPANKGHEAMMYLSYIIANYDSLPNYSIFIHGHRQSWHQEGDMVNLISNLQLPALDKDGYVPLRCDWYPSCPAEIRPIDHDAIVWGPGVHREDAEREIGKAWKELFGSAEMPRTIASQCCAQFAVTRGAIQRRSKEDYGKMREWLLRTDLIDDISGRVFEKLWAYIMTGDAIR